MLTHSKNAKCDNKPLSIGNIVSDGGIGESLSLISGAFSNGQINNIINTNPIAIENMIKNNIIEIRNEKLDVIKENKRPKSSIVSKTKIKKKKSNIFL